ncbi:MAG: hypothetical protein ACP5D9_05510 [Mariniphaga sp.]|jgi:hypothetical protein
MKFFSAIFFLVCLIVFIPFFGEGQSNRVDHKINIEIPEVALLGLVSEESGGINLMAVAPDEAGSPLNLAEIQNHNGIWLNYSSIIRSQNHRRKVVAVVLGEIPQGLRLVVEAAEASGGGGMLGKPTGIVYLSEEPVDVISDIGSCYTGKGISAGHLLSYRLEPDNNLNNIVKQEQTQTTLQVVYTLTDHN